MRGRGSVNWRRLFDQSHALLLSGCGGLCLSSGGLEGESAARTKCHTLTMHALLLSGYGELCQPTLSDNVDEER